MPHPAPKSRNPEKGADHARPLPLVPQLSPKRPMNALPFPRRGTAADAHGALFCGRGEEKCRGMGRNPAGGEKKARADGHSS